MTINELDHDERIALGGLLRLIIRSDGDFTVAEEETVNQLGVKHLGDAAELWSLISDSAQAAPNDAAIRASAQKVTRPAARAMAAAACRLPDGTTGPAAWPRVCGPWACPRATAGA